jgi:hypothetical protein
MADNQKVFSAQLGGGATYFINKRMGLDMYMGFLHHAYKYDESGEMLKNGDDTCKSIYNKFFLLFSFIIVLNTLALTM